MPSESGLVTLNDRDAWADSLLGKLEEVMTKQGGVIQWRDSITGSQITATITPVLVEFIKANRAALVAVGLDAFKGFLALMQKDQTVEALEVVYGQLDNNSLLAQYETDSAKLAVLAAESERERKFWVALAEQLAIKLLPVAIGMLL